MSDNREAAIEAVEVFRDANQKTEEEELIDEGPTLEEQTIAAPPPMPEAPPAATQEAPVAAPVANETGPEPQDVDEQLHLTATTVISVLESGIKELGAFVEDHPSVKRAAGKAQEAIYNLQAAIK